MAGTTASRAYPYPSPGDAVDIPGDMQRLASAVDADVKSVKSTADSASQRVGNLGFARVETGTHNLTWGGSESYGYDIAFTQPFSSPPNVQATLTSAESGSAPVKIVATNVTTTGFRLIYWTCDRSKPSGFTQRSNWIAVGA